MKTWMPFEEISNETGVELVGGKALRLAALKREGHAVPRGGCIPTTVYDHVISTNGFTERMAMELNRKPFSEMRWEEIWDASLRIQNGFLNLPVPGPVEAALRRTLVAVFGDTEVAVRSSAPSEDSGKTSFAGLHESYAGIRGPDSMLHHIRLVWASLWSDRALLYRRELGLDVRTSKMAVVIQAFVRGTASGVVFSQNPLAADEGVVEAVPGRGEDLVEGKTQPDRWYIKREEAVISDVNPAAPNRKPVLTDDQALRLHRVAMKLEEQQAVPQDVEWTIKDDAVYLLQARAITTPPPIDPHGADRRGWYLSLHRSLPELQELHIRISRELLPGMAQEAEALRALDVSALSNRALADEYLRRKGVTRHWLDTYWEYCIPFAHGMRLFGRVYNERLHPDDPYAFIELLSGDPLICLERDNALREIGRMAMTRNIHPESLSIEEVPTELIAAVDAWIEQYGMTLQARASAAILHQQILNTAMAMANTRPVEHSAATLDHHQAKWFAAFERSEQDLAAELLRIGRASYALRDNDNHFLERIRGEEQRVAQEIRRRIAEGTSFDAAIEQELESVGGPASSTLRPQDAPDRRIRGKQLVGQPSSPGTAVGRARVIHGENDLFSFRKGEVLVVDAISPVMTFVVPLAAAIVERRGGMLIHGAIIAREYGIPCVTGVPDATRLVTTGQMLSVDGHLGLVAIRVDEHE
jgi:pyruvate,water dikinase